MKLSINTTQTVMSSTESKPEETSNTQQHQQITRTDTKTIPKINKTSSLYHTASNLLQLLTVFCIFSTLQARPVMTSHRVHQRRSHRMSQPSSQHAVCTSLCHGYYKMCDSRETTD